MRTPRHARIVGDETKSSHGYERKTSLSLTPHRSPITGPSSTTGPATTSTPIAAATQAAPQNPPLSGIVPGGHDPELNVDLTPVPVKPGIDVTVYQVSVQIAAAANQAYSLTFASSSTKPVVKAWGLVTGSLTSPAAAIDGAS
jgi:hypothetical protein